MKEKAYFGGVFHVDCYNREGGWKWSADAPNLVTNEGLQHILDTVFSGGTGCCAHYPCVDCISFPFIPMYGDEWLGAKD